MKVTLKILLNVALVLGLIVLGVVILQAVRPAPRVPDSVQIASQLEEARTAVESRDILAVTQIVSHKYHEPKASRRTQVRAHAPLSSLLYKLQGSDGVRVTQTAPIITVQGDVATSTSHVRITMPPADRVIYDGDVTIHWAREDGTRLWVVPAKVWRAVSAD